MCGLLLAAPARAQVVAEELRVTGFWFDAALLGGAGGGLGNEVDSHLAGRLRLGALYAYEPLIFHAGVSGQLGGLAGRGVGLELEINHFGGGFLQLGVSGVSRDDVMSTATVGFSVVGVEWQHRYAAGDNALLFVLRAPIGIWWFLLSRGGL